MATKTLEQELIALETNYWRAIQDKDFAKARMMTDDPCIVTGAQGVASVDRKTFEQMMKSHAWSVQKFELEGEPEVRLLNDDVAIVAYKIREEMTVDGKPVTLKAADASTWVRRNGQWVCALHTESILGDPFGRDRKAAA
jgi:hypothetical protein